MSDVDGLEEKQQELLQKQRELQEQMSSVSDELSKVLLEQKRQENELVFQNLGALLALVTKHTGSCSDRNPYEDDRCPRCAL